MTVRDADVVVVGAGVVGLACARALAMEGFDTLVLEAADRFGSETSARHSEVIHAGIHYAPGSLKALTCRAGRDALYDHCVRHEIAHRRLGKLIVATDADQLEVLERIAARAAVNGVDDLCWLDRGKVRALEPALDVAAALLSPSTGILDSHAYMLSLLGEAEAHGTTLVCRAPVESIETDGRGFALRVGDGSPARLTCDRVINAAGHGACALARCTEGLPTVAVPTSRYARGSYFRLAGRAPPFGRLIYPVPEPGGLGVHLTLDLSGAARFGPDVEWIDGVDYAVDQGRSARFAAGIRRWWPALPEGRLAADYAGVRPKLERDGVVLDDFELVDGAAFGLPGSVHLLGIESPGLTASLALAERVVSTLLSMPMGTELDEQEHLHR